MHRCSQVDALMRLESGGTRLLKHSEFGNKRDIRKTYHNANAPWLTFEGRDFWKSTEWNHASLSLRNSLGTAISMRLTATIEENL